VDRLAAADAHLWLWVTNAALHHGYQVMQAWGFTYRSCLTKIVSKAMICVNVDIR
jgi:N6-adenosine-specific RNA methylase IME4